MADISIRTNLIMNIHVPIETQERFKCLEFRGKPFNYKGRKMISARHKSTGFKFFYSFEEDFCWMISNDWSVPEWRLPEIK